ncbi:gephyrin-like molybdotransferase Glp [Leucobacter sp. wl10]|uniref:molybdopterin molybdotransferase MoeA n=1 Tax=Leucobacter sp. wl10 TaxID=2304677 RepID=UPI000E5BDB6E|nr:gephyrin-like molybdotransferase Glp [Leucobacter sp. wl10]RGE21116.1 molybdopterin molybdenumtransferase MoeA [Leucobacter sp. wl10]
MSAVRSVEEHLRAVRSLLAPVLARLAEGEPDRLGIDHDGLAGRVSAGEVRAAFPLPPFDNSQMDGYAVRAADLSGASGERPVELPVGYATAAGDAPLVHRGGTASPVMTGAAMPRGADAVVPVEATRGGRFPSLVRGVDAAGGTAAPRERPAGTVVFDAPVVCGAFVRARGEDLEADAVVVRRGARLSPARIGALAAAGVVEVLVRRRPRVLVCATGDELAARGGRLLPGRIHDANTPMLAALLRSAGAIVRTTRCADRPEALRALIERTGDADLVVTSGGISAGAFEVVREALAPLGAEFASVAMQPGGPQGLGLIERSGGAGPLPVLCFPGNPVSTALSAELFLLPALREAAGLPGERPRERRALAHDVSSPPRKLQLRRGRVAPDGAVSVTAPGSHLLGDLADADVIVEIPVGVSRASAGTIVDTWRIA